MGRVLRVFDFDDTLAKSTAYIYVTHKDGTETTLDPGQYAKYKPQRGDEFDFRDFNSMLNNPKVKVMRPLLVFGYDDAPHGHAEVIFDNVVVDVKESLLGCEGAGFAISQGRLGPGRLHHCMRLVGMAERSLDVTYARAKSRVAFGKPLSENSNVLNVLGNCRVEVNGARLLTLYAAHVLDQLGIKDSRARSAVAACKISAPNVACSVIDRCIQLFGGEGVSQDSPLARLYAGARTLRIADGPDEVHLETVAKIDLRRSKL